MAIRRKNNRFQVDVTWKGRRAPRVSVDTYDEAKALEAQYLADLKAGRPIIRVSVPQNSMEGMTLQELVKHTDATQWMGKKSRDSFHQYSRELMRYLGRTIPVVEISYQKILGMLQHWDDRGSAPGTINRKLSTLRMLLREAVNLGVIASVPPIKLRQEYRTRIRYLTEEEERSALEFFKKDGDVDLHDLTVCAIDLGYRQGELLKAQVRDWDPENAKLHLWETKGNKARSNKASNRVREILNRRTKDLKPTDNIFDDMDRRDIAYRWGKWKRSVGLQSDRNLVFHSTRHTCATRLALDPRVPLPVVQKWMGHANIQTTMRYAHLRPDSMDVAFMVINGE